MKILFVCLGNICRSPIAHGILEKKASELSLPWEIDSAATSDYHTGEPPHLSSQKVCFENEVVISSQVARSITEEDLAHYDIIYTMDDSVTRSIYTTFPGHPYLGKVEQITQLHTGFSHDHIPDPYYGTYKDFELVFNLLDTLTDTIVSKHSGE